MRTGDEIIDETDVYVDVDNHVKVDGRSKFVRAGAALQPAARAQVAAINEELAKLGVEFGQKLLADQKANDVLLTADDVAGLPGDQRSAAAIAAKAAGREGGYLFPATRSAAEPFLTASPNRSARELRKCKWRNSYANLRVSQKSLASLFLSPIKL